MTSGKGSYVEYDDGRKMLDFTCGIGVTSMGESFSPSLLCMLIHILARTLPSKDQQSCSRPMYEYRARAGKLCMQSPPTAV